MPMRFCYPLALGLEPRVDDYEWPGVDATDPRLACMMALWDKTDITTEPITLIGAADLQCDEILSPTM